MKDEDKTKAELIKELKFLREEREKVIFKDIAEQKQAEDALRESERRFRDVTENALEWIWEVDASGKYTYASPVCKKILGYKPEELLEKHFYDLFVPEEQEQLKKTAFETFANKQPFREFINQNIHKSGKLVWISTSGVPVLDKKGNLLGYRGADMDITKRKQAEERGKHLNLVLRAIRSVSRLIVKAKNRERLLKGACNNLVKTRGYYNAWIALLNGSGKLETYAEAGIGKAILPMVETLKKGELIVCCQKALKQQGVVTIKDPASTCPECPLVKQHSGRSVMTIRLEYSGKVYGFMSVSIPAHLADDQEEQSLFKEVAGDIAFGIHNIELDEERKQAEENVKKAKDELQMILDSVPALITYKDTESRIIRANKTLANLFKMPVKDIVGKTTEELFPKEQAEKMRKDDREVIVSGKPKRDIIQPYTTPDGIRWLITDKIPYKDKKGKVTGVIGLSKDITVQRKAEQELKLTYQKLKKTMDATIDTMSRIIEAKDPYTSGHQHRICQLAVPLARDLGLSPDKIEGIRIVSLIHDIGKIGLPTEILSKPSKLTDIEFSLIKGHSQIGHDILKSIDFSYPIANIVLQHHENIDGSGYPNGVKDNEISIEAKILRIADVVEAMSSFRPYRPALGIDVALEEITQNRGILYDPEVVDICLKLFKEKGFKFK